MITCGCQLTAFTCWQGSSSKPLGAMTGQLHAIDRVCKQGLEAVTDLEALSTSSSTSCGVLVGSKGPSRGFSVQTSRTQYPKTTWLCRRS